jgi:hypothetical protein
MENDMIVSELFTVSEKEAKNGIFTIMSNTDLAVKTL